VWLSLFLVASLTGGIDAFGAYITTRGDSGRALEQEKALLWNLLKWNLWVLLIPMVVLLAHRFPIRRANVFRNVSIQVLASLCVAVVQLALLFFTYSLIIYRGARLSSVITNRFYVFVSDFLINILIYYFILTVVHAFEFYREARAREVQAAQLETRLAQAQLQALKMQLQPHFLFNALNSISAHLRDTETARRMMARLGDFLRLTLANTGTQVVSLREELEFVRCYLDIERTRFRDRSSVEIDVEPETWDACVPNLILQPIVESAIKHGIAPRREPGRIKMQARRLNGNLQIQIEDSGRGLQGSKLSMASNQNADDEGIGLRNTRARPALVPLGTSLSKLRTRRLAVF
jgi:sensor histidine kinase YesM